MKLIRLDGDKFDFEFTPAEKDILLAVLNRYPLVPESYHRLTKDKRLPNRLENQHLLDEALKSQRLANKKGIVALLDEAGRFTVAKNGFRVRFTRGEIEWLLQILNDVRIGSWIALGSPGYKQERQFRHDKKAGHHLMFMEFAGAFEMYFLDAINGSVLPEPNE
jgi:hypothetical protein